MEEQKQLLSIIREIYKINNPLSFPLEDGPYCELCFSLQDRNIEPKFKQKIESLGISVKELKRLYNSSKHSYPLNFYATLKLNNILYLPIDYNKLKSLQNKEIIEEEIR